jgi:hypothetical protein
MSKPLGLFYVLSNSLPREVLESKDAPNADNIGHKEGAQSFLLAQLETKLGFSTW